MKTTKMIFAFFAGAIIANSLCGCMDFNRMEEISVETVKVEKGYERRATLSHSWDSVYRTRITNDMSSHMTIWRTAGTERTVAFDNIFRPQLTAHSVLLKENYNISAELLNSAVVNSFLHRTTDSQGSELDTVYVELADGQKIWYPVKITNKTVKVGNTNYGFGSLTLLKANYKGATNRLIETSVLGKTYYTTYKTTLTFQEKYADDPKTFEVSVYADATRTVPSDAPKTDFTVKVTDRHRIPLDSLREQLRFTEVFSYASGYVSRVEVSVVLVHHFCGQNFSFQTHDFAYKRTGSNGITIGEEKFVGVNGSWSIYERTDTYSAPFENEVVIDALNSNYTLTHQRATYKDEYVEVAFGYEGIRVIEMQTNVERYNSMTAKLYNRINTIYLGYGQDLENNVSLYIR